MLNHGCFLMPLSKKKILLCIFVLYVRHFFVTVPVHRRSKKLKSREAIVTSDLPKYQIGHQEYQRVGFQDYCENFSCPYN